MGMGILHFFTNLFGSFFTGAFPEAKKKQSLQKIEAELKKIQPCIYKSGMLQPNFPELFRILYENTKILDDLLSKTICSADTKSSSFYGSQLLLTGYSDESRKKIEKLEFENRKSEAAESDQALEKVLEKQKHTLEFLLKELNTQEFLRIDSILGQMQQLSDICRFNFISIIHRFDPEYDGFDASAKGNFAGCVPSNIATELQDFYYVTAKFSVTSSLACAVLAVAKIAAHGELSEEEEKKYTGALKKINTVLTKYLTPDIQKKIICLARHEPEVSLQAASYQANFRQKFAKEFQQKFESDENRIKTEMKDDNISAELKRLFENQPLLELSGYNSILHKKLVSNGFDGFDWVMPLEILKTFLTYYFDEDIQALLNDIIIEGFFYNHSYKTEFSGIVYACLELLDSIKGFEKTFERGEGNDQAILESYIQDSRNDNDFVKKLKSSVDKINVQAHNLVQDVTVSLFNLYKQVTELFVDAKKTKPDTVSNIKVLFASSRNRDRAGKLESQIDKWKILLELMKNYAIIGEIKQK